MSEEALKVFQRLFKVRSGVEEEKEVVKKERREGEGKIITMLGGD